MLLTQTAISWPSTKLLCRLNALLGLDVCLKFDDRNSRSLFFLFSSDDETQGLCQSCVEGQYSLIQDLTPCNQCPEEGVSCSPSSVTLHKGFWMHEKTDGTFFVERCPPGLEKKSPKTNPQYPFSHFIQVLVLTDLEMF